MRFWKSWKRHIFILTSPLNVLNVGCENGPRRLERVQFTGASLFRGSRLIAAGLMSGGEGSTLAMSLVELITVDGMHRC